MRAFLLIFFLLTSVLAKCQDIIIMSNGDIYEGKIKEITENQVKYQKKELPEGPLFSLKTENILMIKYENGHTDVFNEQNQLNKTESEDVNSEGVFVDPRDDKEYQYKQIGDLIWFTENLQYKTPNSACYNNSKSNCDIYGYYYPWEEAVEACPEGWHLATDEDWVEIEVHAGMELHQAYKKGWRGTHPGQAKELLKGGSTGLDLLITGYLHHNNKSKNIRKEAFYWTSSADKSYCAWMRHFTSRASIEREEMTLSYKLPVRCVKD